MFAVSRLQQVGSYVYAQLTSLRCVYVGKGLVIVF